MKIEVFEPSSIGDISTKKITEFKFDMNQFSVVDRVDFFKKASELICSDLINVFVTKENLQRNYKRIENKLKVEIVEKQALQVKKSELEKRIAEPRKNNGSEGITSILQEKDAEIQALKKKFEMPHDVGAQIVELKIVLQENETLEA